MAVHLRGGPVNGLVEFVKRELTPEQQARVLEALDEADRAHFDGDLLAHQEVPLGKVTAYTVAAAKAKGEPLERFAHRAGRYGAEKGVSTVYKFIMMIMSPQAVLKKAPFMWSRVYDAGEMEVETAGNGAQIRITDFEAHPATCGRITGWFEVIAERTGAKGLEAAHTACMSRGDEACRWDFTWNAWGR